MAELEFRGRLVHWRLETAWRRLAKPRRRAKAAHRHCKNSNNTATSTDTVGQSSLGTWSDVPDAPIVVVVSHLQLLLAAGISLKRTVAVNFQRSGQ
jgi:hypothetical protein